MSRAVRRAKAPSKKSRPKLAEILLRQQTAAMRASIDGLAILDQKGRYTYVNEAHAKIYGYADPKKMIGKAWNTLYAPKELKRFETKIMPGFWKEGRWRGEAVGRRKDGETFPQEVSLTSIEGGGMVCVVRDLSEQKRVEKERERLLALEKRARAEAEHEIRAKDEFLAVVSHELRTPLTAMLGWTLLLREGSIDKSKQDHALTIIERNMRMQAQIVEDMFDVSSIVTGKLRLDIRSVELSPLLTAALDNIRPEARLKSIRIESDIEEGEFPILGDPDRLQQVLWNLLTNAVKFTPVGGLLRASLKRDKTKARIIVSDSGKGIGAEFLPYVFDRFRQEENVLTRTHRGLGLGLAIVRHITELHGGTVQAESPGVGLGSTFTVSLPLASPDRTAEPG